MPRGTDIKEVLPFFRNLTDIASSETHGSRSPLCLGSSHALIGREKKRKDGKARMESIAMSQGQILVSHRFF